MKNNRVVIGFFAVCITVLATIFIGQAIDGHGNNPPVSTNAPGWEGVTPEQAAIGRACGIDPQDRWNIILQHTEVYPDGIHSDRTYRFSDHTTATVYRDGTYYCERTHADGRLGDNK